MSQEKKRVRTKWREAVFKRAGHQCQARDSSPLGEVRCHLPAVDAHHIKPRSTLVGGGYDDVDNGVALCENHHVAAEWGCWSEETLRQWAKEA